MSWNSWSLAFQRPSKTILLQQRMMAAAVVFVVQQLHHGYHVNSTMSCHKKSLDFQHPMATSEFGAVDFPVVPDPPKCHQNTEALHLQQCRVWHSSRPHWPRHPPPIFHLLEKVNGFITATLDRFTGPKQQSKRWRSLKSTPPVKVLKNYYGLAHRKRAKWHIYIYIIPFSETHPSRWLGSLLRVPKRPISNEPVGWKTQRGTLKPCTASLDASTRTRR